MGHSGRLDLLRVHHAGPAPHRGVLVAGATVMACALGRAGIAVRKREGDGTTPAGDFPLRTLYFRPDRGPRPRCGLPAFPLDRRFGWCEDPASFAYNRPVAVDGAPHAAPGGPPGLDRMWRDDHLYDLVIVIGHNDDPPLRPFGSAVFLHLARDGYGPTAGCVALSRRDLLRLLPRIGPRTRISIG